MKIIALGAVLAGGGWHRVLRGCWTRRRSEKYRREKKPPVGGCFDYAQIVTKCHALRFFSTSTSLEFPATPARCSGDK